MHTKAFRSISIIAMLLWMLLIFFLSSETAAESSATSGGFSRWIFNMFYPSFSEMSDYRQAELIENFSFIIRKTAHIALYTVLGCLVSLSVISNSKTHLCLEGFLSMSICILYASSDEFHQLHVDGRSGEVRDVIIDSCGALLGVVTVFALYALIRKRKVGKKMKRKELMQKYLELTEEMQNILSDNARLQSELEQLRDFNSELQETIASSEIKEEVTVDVNHETNDEIIEIQLSDETEFAANIIGQMIISATECSNKLSLNGEKNRELINMILGRTEVEKGNILDILLSETDFETKKKMMLSCKNASEEYFESVMAQLDI